MENLIKKIFVDIGFFRNGIMFVMIWYGSFRLRVDENTIPDFEAKGMKVFQSDSKKKGMPYWEVPADVLEDKSILKVGWKSIWSCQKCKEVNVNGNYCLKGNNEKILFISNHCKRNFKITNDDGSN